MIGDDITAALPELRQQTESMMRDTCRIAGGGDRVWNDATGRFDTPPVTVYEGPCRLQASDVQPRKPTAGDAEFTTLSFVLRIPFGVNCIRPGHTITILSSDTDPALLGRTFTVSGLVHKTQLTSRRYICEEVQ